MARVRKPMTAKGAKAIGIMFIILWLIFASLAIFFIVKGSDLQDRCTEETDGVVVSIRKKKGTGRYDHTKYYPTVEYKVGSKKYRHELETGNNKEDDNEPGDIITIFYDPDDPSVACTEKETRTNKFAGGFMLAFSGFDLLVAIVMFVRSKQLKDAVQSGMISPQEQGYQYSPELDQMNK